MARRANQLRRAIKLASTKLSFAMLIREWRISIQ
jgi:hypothetical protein